MYISLTEAQKELDRIRARRAEINNTGAEDLVLIDKLHSVKRKVRQELEEIRIHLKYCSISECYQLRSRENELLEFLHKN